MLTLLFISTGLTVLAIVCVIVYNKGYDAGYEQATIDVRFGATGRKTTP